MGAKKFAPRRCVIAKARKSSPCALKTPQIWHFCACWASFFAERPLEGPCWASIFAPTGAAPKCRRCRGTLQTGGGGGFAPCEALLRRVVGVSYLCMATPCACARGPSGVSYLCMAQLPSIGGGAAAVRGGVAPTSQITSVKNAENGLLVAKWSAFWVQRCLAWCAGRT